MSRQPRQIDRRTINMTPVRCLTCCVAAKLGKLEMDVQDADTWVPVWRTQAVNGQLMMGLAIEPVCFTHLTVAEQTAVDQGKLVTGNGQPPDQETLEKANETLRQLGKGFLP